jgi:hypothetical protein
MRDVFHNGHLLCEGKYSDYYWDDSGGFVLRFSPRAADLIQIHTYFLGFRVRTRTLPVAEVLSAPPSTAKE